MSENTLDLQYQPPSSPWVRSWGITVSCGQENHDRCGGTRMWVTPDGAREPAGPCTCRCHEAGLNAPHGACRPRRQPMSRPTMTFDEMGDLGVVQEINRQLLHPIGLALARHPDGTLTILTDPDPDGWTFEGFDLHAAASAFATRQAEWHRRRLAALGFVVQPLPTTGHNNPTGAR